MNRDAAINYIMEQVTGTKDLFYTFPEEDQELGRKNVAGVCKKWFDLEKAGTVKFEFSKENIIAIVCIAHGDTKQFWEELAKVYKPYQIEVVKKYVKELKRKNLTLLKLPEA